MHTYSSYHFALNTKANIIRPIRAYKFTNTTAYNVRRQWLNIFHFRGPHNSPVHRFAQFCINSFQVNILLGPPYIASVEKSASVDRRIFILLSKDISYMDTVDLRIRAMFFFQETIKIANMIEFQ